MTTHGWSGYLGGCRCDACRAANAEVCARQQASRLARGVPQDVPHGVKSTYGNWGCRCPECSVAHADYCAEYGLTKLTPEQRERYQQTENASRRERYRTDPEYRERIKARNREHAARRRAAID